MRRHYVFIIVFIFTLTFVWVENQSVAKDKEGQTIKVYNVQKGEYEEVVKINKDKNELRQALTDEQFHITQEAGTERPFTGEYLKNKKKGVYKCG